MRFPKAIDNLFGAFHQDSLNRELTLEEYVDYSFLFLTQEQKYEAKRYMERLLADSPSPEAIREFWEATPHDIRIDDDGQLLTFLSMIRDRLPSEPHSK